MDTFFEPIIQNTQPTGDALSPFINYVCLLEGYKTKFKNLHWSALNDPVHLRIDEFLSKIGDYQDLIAEETQGIYQDFPPNSIKGKDIQDIDPITNIKNLLESTNSFYRFLGDGIVYVGMRSNIEVFITDCNKYIYLLRKAAR